MFLISKKYIIGPQADWGDVLMCTGLDMTSSQDRASSQKEATVQEVTLKR